MTDFFYWGGPVYCSTAEKLAWERPTKVLCKPLEGSSNGAFFSTLGADPVGSLLAKAGVTERGSIGFGGFSAFHGFLDPLLQAQADQVDYVHLADACFQGAGATAAKKGLLAFAKRAVAGKARMTVTTNGPWDQDISYWGPAGSKYEGTKFSLTSGAKCFGNVWREAVGSLAEASADIPAGVPKPDRIFRAGELYWFHYEGKGVKDPHGWHTNELARPFMQLYGVPWMAGHRGAGPLLPGLPSISGEGSAGVAVLLLALVAPGILGGYWVAKSKGYLPNHNEVLGYVAQSFPKVCRCCGRSYTRRTWEQLPICGTQSFPWGEEGEFRNCHCGSTLYVIVVDGDAEA